MAPALWACWVALATVLAWDAAHAVWGVDNLVSGWFVQWPQSVPTGAAIWAAGDWARTAYQWQRYWAFACLLVVWLMVWWPLGVCKLLLRRERLVVALTVVLSVLTVNGLKHQSLTSCPVELAVFGGKALQVSHWAWGVADGGYGHCFPSGHASGAFAFAAVAVFLGAHSPRWGAALAAAVMVQALAFGALQVARGEHFVSHVLWTGSVCLWLAVAVRASWVALHRWWMARA